MGACSFPSRASMLPPMKSMKAGAKTMTKGALSKAIATEHGLKQRACSDLLKSIAEIATKEVKNAGIFTLHGLCRIKTRTKPATKAGVRSVFGKEVKVKAKPARTIVKGYAVAIEKADLSGVAPFESFSKAVDRGNPTMHA